MSRKKGLGYPRAFRLNAARLVVEGGYTYSKAIERLGVSTESHGCIAFQSTFYKLYLPDFGKTATNTRISIISPVYM